MIYLILRIFVYMIVALGLGAGAGWLTRQLIAQKREDELKQDLNESRARIPQLESLARARDQQIGRLKQSVQESETELAQLKAQGRELNEALRQKERELKQAGRGGGERGINARLDDGELLDEAAPAAETQQLERDIVELREALTERDERIRSLEAADVGQGEKADGAAALVHDLEERLRQKADEYQDLRNSLERESRKVAQLERERELQNTSLLVLHQQLEAERERDDGDRRASG
jgi:chromosome segregation ATPase